jgi:hypothetical protein
MLRSETSVDVGRDFGSGRHPARTSQSTEASRGVDWGAESGRRRDRGRIFF